MTNKEKKDNIDNLYLAYERLHSVLEQKSPDFGEAVKNFLLHTSNNPTILDKEYCLLVSLLEYLYYEAPKDEHNLFMVVEMIEGDTA